MAAEPGFEPGLEDSKSPVLPLHNSATFFYLVPRIPFITYLRGSQQLSAEGRARTDTKGYPSAVFETAASTYSATSAYLNEV